MRTKTLNLEPGLSDMGYTPCYLLGSNGDMIDMSKGTLTIQNTESVEHILADYSGKKNARIWDFNLNTVDKFAISKEIKDRAFYEIRRYRYYRSILGDRAKEWVKYSELPISSRYRFNVPVKYSLILLGLINPNNTKEIIDSSLRFGYYLGDTIDGYNTLYAGKKFSSGQDNFWYTFLNRNLRWRYVTLGELKKLRKLGIRNYCNNVYSVDLDRVNMDSHVITSIVNYKKTAFNDFLLPILNSNMVADFDCILTKDGKQIHFRMEFACIWESNGIAVTSSTVCINRFKNKTWEQLLGVSLKSMRLELDPRTNVITFENQNVKLQLYLSSWRYVNPFNFIQSLSIIEEFKHIGNGSTYGYKVVAQTSRGKVVYVVRSAVLRNYRYDLI